MKLTHELVTGIRKLIEEEGKSQAYVSRLFEISDTTVCNLVKANFDHDAYTRIGKKQPKNKRFNLLNMRRREYN